MYIDADRGTRLSFYERILSPILFFFILLSVLPEVYAQNNTLYLMYSIPEANELNPALRHPCKIYLELPVISSFRLNIRNTGFGFHDAVHTGTGAQSGSWTADLDNLEKKLSRMNYALANTDIDLLGAGFEYKDWYFTVLISNHTATQISYPHDIVSLKDGNWDVNGGNPVKINLNNIGVNSTLWNSIGISVSKDLSEGLRFGLRLKYLNGMANLNTRNTTVTLNTTPDPITLDAEVKYKVNSSLPVKLAFASNGLVNGVDFTPALQNLAGNYIFNGNRGLSIDGGVIYDLDEATQLSASFTDLGFILWRKNVNNLTGAGKFIFSGIDINKYILNPGQNDLLVALKDSLINAFQASSAKKGYITSLPLNLYGGITRQLLPNLKAGAMTWIEINSMHLRPSLTLSLNFTPFRAFAATMSYTIMNNKFNQIGTGLAFGRRGAQFYILTDNIPVNFTRDASTSLIWPYNARMISLRFGVNLFFGCDKKDKGSGSTSKSRYPKSKTTGDCPAYK